MTGASALLKSMLHALSDHIMRGCVLLSACCCVIRALMCQAHTKWRWFGCRSKVYGLTLLVFSDSDCKISEVLTFMQPFPSQRRELLKPQLQ